MSLHPIIATPERMPWIPDSQALGELSLFQGEETVHFKVLSDRRSEGGGMAQIVRFSPPPGMLIKIAALSNPSVNRTGSKLRLQIPSGSRLPQMLDRSV